MAKGAIEFFKNSRRRDPSGEENFWGCAGYGSTEPIPSLVETEVARLKRKGIFDEIVDKRSGRWESRPKGVRDFEDFSFFVVDFIGE